MTLYSNWRDILRRAWSIRLMLLAGLLTGCEAILNVVGADALPVPTWARLAIVFAVIVSAFIARLVAQRDL